MQHRPKESAVAGASQDATPRIAIVLSSFRGSSDHDGTRVDGLRDPQPVRAKLTFAQIDCMMQKAIDLSETRKGRIEAIIAPEDWVLVLCGAAPRLEMVQSLLSYLAARKAGARLTLASPSCADLCSQLSRAHPRAYFEVCDLRSEEMIEMPVPRTRSRRCVVPTTFQRCDKVISIAPLGIAPTFANYLSMVGSATGAEASVDLFSLHPADFAIVGGDRNIIIAGAKPVAVDAVASAVMGAKPAEIACLQLAYRRGLGILDLDSMWTRGNDVEEAAREFRKGHL